VVGVGQREQLEVWVHLRAVDRDLAGTLFAQVDERPKLYLGHVIRLTPQGYPQFMSVPEARFHQDVILDPTPRVRSNARCFDFRSARRPIGEPVCPSGEASSGLDPQALA
jgi:hypothetical protein